MENLIVALLQTNLIWENPAKNRKLIEQQLAEVNELVDLIVLPEMFTSGFTMNPKAVAETMQGETIDWLKKIADEKNSAITGSLIIKENGKYYNRLVFVFPNGEIQYYNKRHLFTLAGEEKVYTAGKEKLIVEFKGLKICLLVCYDLRFPVYSRNVEEYDVLIYVANWPKPRINAWDILLKARAVENMSYVIGVNRVGFDANNHEYVGHSQAIDSLGNYLIEPQEKEGLFVLFVEKEKLHETRKKLNFLNDMDSFKLDYN
jgi:predicted amidohydrolase